MKYQIIYADPPWLEVGGGVRYKRGADRHYPLMRTQDIIALPVQDIADDNAHLYLWVTNNHLLDGLVVMWSWGFRYVTAITWVKDRFGLGQYFRGATEHCLFGVRGFLPYLVKDAKRAQHPTYFYAPRGGHSCKPEAMRAIIEHVSGAPDRTAIELFARRPSPGWDVWGNEVESNNALPTASR